MQVTDLPQGCVPVLVSPRLTCPGGHNSKPAFRASLGQPAANDGPAPLRTTAAKNAKVNVFILASTPRLHPTKLSIQGSFVKRIAARLASRSPAPSSRNLPLRQFRSHPGRDDRAQKLDRAQDRSLRLVADRHLHESSDRGERPRAERGFWRWPRPAFRPSSVPAGRVPDRTQRAIRAASRARGRCGSSPRRKDRRTHA